MSGKGCHPRLVAILCLTLKGMERETGSANDRSLAKLKASVLRALAQREFAQDSYKFIRAGQDYSSTGGASVS
jgi:hypothetical protein